MTIMKLQKIITGIFTESVEVDRALIRLVVVGDEDTGCGIQIPCAASSILDFSQNRIPLVISTK